MSIVGHEANESRPSKLRDILQPNLRPSDHENDMPTSMRFPPVSDRVSRSQTGPSGNDCTHCSELEVNISAIHDSWDIQLTDFGLLHSRMLFFQMNSGYNIDTI